MATRTIDLIRHGQYGPDGLLTPVGRAQIELLGARYRAEGGPTELWASPVPRATETGEILGAALGLTPRRVVGLAEGIPSVPDPLPPGFDGWPADSVARHKARFDKVLDRILKPARGADKHLLLACHGNATRYLWTVAMGLPPEFWWVLRIHNGSVTRLFVTPTGRVRGVGFNDIGHLPPALQTET
ncbi:MAG: histidine phosphatase family protein [Myxococcales bacterium]|nr:histidine phosphatase family protein [Myxococcales bacterium]MCB9669573.1 histidine phosphatase family protein [Alphaproteobacteria bacterium]MCB9694893.1 histidine phosphatase family protein [Alphaproteobacteria bacterium]